MSRRVRDESGAIAVVAALTSVLLFLMAGLVIDLGLARDVKRQSQNSSDAGALAAANALYANSVVPDFVAAGAAAKNYAAMNFGVTAADWNTCTDAGALTYKPVGTPCISFDSATKPTLARVLTPTRKVDTGFGRAAGVTTIPISSVAEASTVKPLTDLRPWALCSEQVPATANTEVTLIYMPGNGHTSTHGCAASNAGGNWWLMLCPGDQNGNTGQTEANIRNGCQTPITPVPDQPSDSSLAQYLIDACATLNQSCLSGDTGANLHLFDDEWQTVVGKEITMPIFCDWPACAKSTVTGTGSNAKYPIYKMVSLEICGFGLKGNYSTDWPSSGACSTLNTNNYSPKNTIDDKEYGFLVVFKTVNEPLRKVDPNATTNLTR